ncbi:MAG: tetratricopeptide repeat protein [Chitinophagaceae bacterium]|nr:MAG: tetratricopeptide repeat protein [Chitinophagaceae bacterium]
MERIDKLREFLKANPDDSFLGHALALEYIKLNDLKLARETFEALLARDPGYVGSYYHLAKLLEGQGDQEGAILWYEKGLAEAQKAGDRHAYGELRAALDDLIY